MVIKMHDAYRFVALRMYNGLKFTEPMLLGLGVSVRYRSKDGDTNLQHPFLSDKPLKVGLSCSIWCHQFHPGQLQGQENYSGQAEPNH
ncbi:hypothetical protein J1N35_033635 [Gossypium stocksii]|uniref:Uncharacterized protein n=1 Tax=Gossypium stocksii TaxID=47602 RepID=A0A9D3ZPS7_9ROSI|nr:hypothetical protein J1N35_033635 [Gossypium stocksii]